ncbi:hypothetical protein A2U01_0050687, partial [Trifolium medium]|nr:hypothetical protein [Trifolium medium]
MAHPQQTENGIPNVIYGGNNFFGDNNGDNNTQTIHMHDIAPVNIKDNQDAHENEQHPIGNTLSSCAEPLASQHPLAPPSPQ